MNHLLDLLIHSLQQSLLLLPMVLGIYFSYGCAKLTDLTIEGSFVLGACVYAISLTLTGNSFLSFMIGSFAGSFSGIISGIIQRKNRMNSLMAGIITLFILQSMNIMVLGRPNINLLSYHHTFSTLFDLLGLSLILCVAFMMINRSIIGLKFKALGSNPKLFNELFSLDYYKIFVLSLSNICAAMSGVLTASVNGYTDIYMGQGIAIIGMGTFILGRTLFPHPLSGILGLMIYFSMMHILLSLGVDTLVMKLLIGMFLAIILGGRRVSY